MNACDPVALIAMAAALIAAGTAAVYFSGRVLGSLTSRRDAFGVDVPWQTEQSLALAPDAGRSRDAARHAGGRSSFS